MDSLPVTFRFCAGRPYKLLRLTFTFISSEAINLASERPIVAILLPWYRVEILQV